MSDAPITFINVFEVEPAAQKRLAALLTEALDQVISRRPGFINARLLVSADGRTVINEANWTDAQAVAATREDPAAADYAARAMVLAKAHPGVYRVHALFPR